MADLDETIKRHHRRDLGRALDHGASGHAMLGLPEQGHQQGGGQHRSHSLDAGMARSEHFSARLAPGIARARQQAAFIAPLQRPYLTQHHAHGLGQRALVGAEGRTAVALQRENAHGATLVAQGHRQHVFNAQQTCRLGVGDGADALVGGRMDDRPAQVQGLVHGLGQPAHQVGRGVKVRGV